MPFVGCSAFPRGQQSSPGHAPCEHNWPLRRPDPAPGRSRRRECRRQVGCQPAATTFPPRRCRGYPEEQQGCIATSRGGHWGTARDPPGAAGDTAHRQACAQTHPGVPQRYRDTSPRPRHLRGPRESSLPRGSSRQSEAVTQQRHFGAACSEVLRALWLCSRRRRGGTGPTRGRAGLGLALGRDRCCRAPRLSWAYSLFLHSGTTLSTPPG